MSCRHPAALQIPREISLPFALSLSIKKDGDPMKDTPLHKDCYWITATLGIITLFLLGMPGPSGAPGTEPASPADPALPADTFQYRADGLIAPPDFTPLPVMRRVFTDGQIRLTLMARRFAQGEPVLAEVTGKMADPRLHWDGQPIPLSRRPWGYRGLIALGPNCKTGATGWRIDCQNGGRNRSLEGSIPVAASDFPRDEVWIPASPRRGAGPVQPKPPDPTATERALAKQAALARFGPDLLRPGRAFPTPTTRQSSPFYALRRIVRYRMDGTNRTPLASFVVPHLGTDLAARRGEPVLALASGLVTFSGQMPFEGNFVVLDHGLGVISYYMHMHLLLVQKGEKLASGTVLGLVGSTGFSTGPHLHVSLRIRGVQVDPLALLSLPIR
jgi:hypothetical protein